MRSSARSARATASRSNLTTRTSPRSCLCVGTSSSLGCVSSLPHPPLPAVSLTSPEFSTLSAWPRDYIPRQLLSLATITLLGIVVLYFLFAYLSYKYIFNHEMMKHPRFLKNQIKLEIQSSLKAFPLMILLTLPWFMGEIRGYSKLYDNVEDYGWGYFFFSIFL